MAVVMVRLATHKPRAEEDGRGDWHCDCECGWAGYSQSLQFAHEICSEHVAAHPAYHWTFVQRPGVRWR